MRGQTRLSDLIQWRHVPLRPFDRSPTPGTYCHPTEMIPMLPGRITAMGENQEADATVASKTIDVPAGAAGSPPFAGQRRDGQLVGPLRETDPEPSQCYTTDGGIRIHVKPGCRCPRGRR